MSESETTLYDFVGGLPAFIRLVDEFYAGVDKDPILRPLYPETLDASREHLALFLAQYFGGPNTYSQRRGHPRLRMRHIPFAIGERERDAWLRHMLAALERSGVEEPAKSEMRRYFSEAATFLINQPA